MSSPHASPVLEVRHLVKAFGATRAVDGISFTVSNGEILVIVGGSGCGKTTTLRCIAGLEDVTEGEILLDGHPVAGAGLSVAPEKRGIGMVFQSYALWPHKTVAQNVAYGLERSGVNRDEIRHKVDEVLEQVSLAGFRDRYPSSLSGGQQQRVALARSAVLRPKLLLLDEPLSNLDAKLREHMRDELQSMIRLFGMTAIHITHDQTEAMALGDRIVCMRAGRIEQEGTPHEIYRAPANAYVADFIGGANLVEPQSIVRAGGSMEILLHGPRLHVAGDAPDGKSVAAIRPESVKLSRHCAEGPNVFPAVIGKAVYLGSHSVYQIIAGGLELQALSSDDFAVGEAIFARVDPQEIRLVPA